MKKAQERPLQRRARFRPVYFTTLLLGSLAVTLGCHDDPPNAAPVATASLPLEAACADGVDNDSDGTLDCDDADCQSPGGECVPAPPLDRTVATTLWESAQYLYGGENPLQKAAHATAFDRHRIAMLRGRVIDTAGVPLAGAKITVKGHPEYGYTHSRGDGMFDMVVNGGGRMVIGYDLADHLPVQRAVDPGWQRTVRIPDAGMVTASTRSTQINANSAQAQVIVGDAVADEYGAREPLVVIEPNTIAPAVLPDGTTEELSTLTVTATEYPISSESTYSPGSANSLGGLSYGLEFVVKEADALTVEHVAFSKPVSLYVEALGAMPVGKALSVQHYDRKSGQWEPGLRGTVLEVLEVADGVATIDSDGDGAADSLELLEQQGIAESDQKELAKRYAAGQRLWHAELWHFSGHEVKAQGTPPAGAVAPVRRGLVTKTLDAPTYVGGVVVEYQASTHREPVTGTPFTLHYQSNRTLSYGAGRQLEVPLVGETVPAGLKKIKSRVAIGGRVYEQDFAPPAANLRHNVVWDGKDANGRLVQAQQVAEVSIAYVYQDTASSQSEAILPINFAVALGNWDARAFEMGGFSLDVHHAYDPAQQILYFGNGTQRSGANVSLAAKPACSVAGFDLGTPDSLIAMPDGSLIVTDDQQGTYNFGRVLKISADGTPQILFGDGAPGAAAAVQMSQPQGVVVTSDGRLIVADILDEKLVELGPDGTLRVLVGADAMESPVVQMALNRPDGIALGPRDELYFVDADRVYRFEGGQVVVFAGGGTDIADSITATDALLVVPSGLAVDKSGNVYVSERGVDGQEGGHRVRKITPAGVITTVAGTSVPGYSGDGDVAQLAQLNDPHGLALDPEGRLYIVDQGNNRIRRVSSDGLIQTVIGGGTEELAAAALAVNIKLDHPDGITVGPDGSLYFATKNSILRAFVGIPRLNRTDNLVPSSDGRTLYRFDERGKHLETIDAVTGITELTFAYDSAEQLTSIKDKDGNVTKVGRDGAGKATAIVAPHGQRTALGLNASGDVATITDPLQRVTTISWDPQLLVANVNDPKAKAVTYGYDPTGRLLSVTNPTGYGKTLARSDAPNGWSVAVTDSVTKQTTDYGIEYAGESWTRTVTKPDKSKTIWIDAGASITRKAADGTTEYVTFAPDPAFGAQVLQPSDTTLTLPSGKEIVTDLGTDKFMADLHNPLALTYWQDSAGTNGRWYESRYTRSSRVLRQTTPMGRTTEVTLDALGHPISMTGTGMPRTEWEYDALGRVRSMTRTANGQVRKQTFDYDDRGWVEYFADALSEKTKYGRDDVGRLTELQRPDNAKTIWALDNADNVTALTPPSNQAHWFGYDPATKLLTTVTPPAAATPAGAGNTSLAYGPRNELVTLTRGDGRTVGFEYDTMARLSAQKLSNAALNFDYEDGHMTRIHRSDSVTLDQTFDGPLWMSSKWSGGVSGTVRATYDDNLWLSSLTVNEASTVSFTYDDDGLLLSAAGTVGGVAFARDAATGAITGTSVGSVTGTQAYTDFGEISRLSADFSGTPLFDQNVVERDALGRIRHLTEAVQGVNHDVTYEYDLAGRLTKQTRDGVATLFTYDANGNRTGVQTGSGAPVSATYDAQDRILIYGGQTLTHDGHGDLQVRSDGTKSLTLSYDELGNLLKATSVDGGATKSIEYMVDGLGRRVARRVNGQFDRAWLYRDSLRPEAEINSAGVFTQFVYASNSPLSGAPDALIRAGVMYRVIKDHLGSVRLVINAATGAVAQSLDYDAWGRVLGETGAGFQPFGFAGGLCDAETKLVRFGARDYDPEIGRWTNKDPIGFAGQQGNVYLYVGGDPVNQTDLSGLGPENECSDEGWTVVFACSAGVVLEAVAWESLRVFSALGAIKGGSMCGGAIGYFKTCVDRHDEYLNVQARRQRQIDDCRAMGRRAEIDADGSVACLEPTQ